HGLAGAAEFDDAVVARIVHGARPPAPRRGSVADREVRPARVRLGGREAPDPAAGVRAPDEEAPRAGVVGGPGAVLEPRLIVVELGPRRRGVERQRVDVPAWPAARQD